MRELLKQTRVAVNTDLYYVALVTSLAIPDIAAALDSDDGRTCGKRYANWYDKWVKPQLSKTRGRENPLSGAECYAWRCAMLHQGRSQRETDTYRHIMFAHPKVSLGSIHYCTVGGDTLLIRLADFVEEMAKGCEDWLCSIEETERFKNNYGKFARCHPDGLNPYIVGVPVIG